MVRTASAQCRRGNLHALELMLPEMVHIALKWCAHGGIQNLGVADLVPDVRQLPVGVGHHLLEVAPHSLAVHRQYVHAILPLAVEEGLPNL